MNIEIVSKYENKLLKRVEYIFKVNHDASGTPSRKELKEEIVKQLGVPADQVVIRKIKTPFGVNESLVDVLYYYDKDTLMKVEPKHILRREGIIEK
ncbi:MAG: 30S ribosomal protein S24e [Candidatus Njordarchaeia archaeon]